MEDEGIFFSLVKIKNVIKICCDIILDRGVCKDKLVYFFWCGWVKNKFDFDVVILIWGNLL